MIKLFIDQGTSIFDRSSLVGNFFNWIDRSKYNPAGIEKVLQN